MFPASTHNGQAVLAFPDVCKTPSTGTPVPAPYPIMTTVTTATKSVNTKTFADAGILKSRLGLLHQKLMTMNAGNATAWHAVLDDYVQTSAELYKSLFSR